MAVKKPKINKKLTKVNFTNANRSKNKIDFLVKHYVGAEGGAEANCDFFENTYLGASAHYFIGHNGEIWQCVNENDIAWHCGASSYKHKDCRNSNSIGVELCVKKDKNGKWYYTEETKAAAVELFAYLMHKYNIDVDHVLRHYDVTGKICGEPDVREGSAVWKEFKTDIEKYRKSSGKSTTTKKQTSSLERQKAASSKKEDSLPYYVNTTVDSLYVRKNADKGSASIGYINEKTGSKTKYKVTKVKDGWGYLPKKGGWIALAYTKKVS